MEQIQKNYLPAAGHDWMLPVYDPLVMLLGGHAARRALVLLRVVGFRTRSVGYLYDNFPPMRRRQVVDTLEASSSQDSTQHTRDTNPRFPALSD